MPKKPFGPRPPGRKPAGRKGPAQASRSGGRPPRRSRDDDSDRGSAKSGGRGSSRDDRARYTGGRDDKDGRQQARAKLKSSPSSRAKPSRAGDGWGFGTRRGGPREDGEQARDRQSSRDQGADQRRGARDDRRRGDADRGREAGPRSARPERRPWQASQSDGVSGKGGARGTRSFSVRPRVQSDSAPAKPRVRRDEGVPAITGPMRVAKALARSGLCSRREAERWVTAGRVRVNGEVLESPALDVTPKDTVLVDGEPLPLAELPKLWRYYKPKGLVTTHRDPERRPTVFDNLPPELPRVVSIGRLDFNTEGLLLLTNSGELARHLELPSTGWLRRYRVRAKGRVMQSDLDTLKDGVEVDGIRYGPIDAEIDSTQGANMWLSVGVREGKNREVRRVLASLKLDVNRLIRVSYGPFQLLDLRPGEIGYVRRRVLTDQLGKQLAEEFGLAGQDEDEGPPQRKFRRSGGGGPRKRRDRD